jgi:alpha-tubulin suppressor-like RCC1 family protein
MAKKLPLFLSVSFLVVLSTPVWSNPVGWGSNGNGSLGDGTNTDSDVPVAVDTSGVLNGKTLTQVDGGGYNACALTTEGLIYCWGNNNYGQLGNGEHGLGTQSDVPVAVNTSGVLSGKTVTQISVGKYLTCALTSDGMAYCWGSNSNGSLGDGTNTDSDVPVAVNTSGVLSGKTITEISAGDGHACALTSDGMAYCWGWNNWGQLGNGNGTNSNVPVAVDMSGALSGKIVTQIATGSVFTCALTSEGLPYCWGSDWNGQLGNGNPLTASNVPVAVTISGALSGKTITQVSTGASEACALTSAGLVYCWGRNNHGQLGDATNTDSSVPVAVDTSGVLSGKTVSQISNGALFACARSTDGGAYCWGKNDYGQLGNGITGTDSNIPVAVINSGVLSGWAVTLVSVGEVSSHALIGSPSSGAPTVPVPTLPEWAKIVMLLLMIATFGWFRLRRNRWRTNQG